MNAITPTEFFYRDGTMTLTNGSDIVEGQFTGWDPAVQPFDFIVPGAGVNGLTMIAEVIDATHIRLPRPWSGPDLVAVPYFICRWIKHTDPRVYGVRVSDYLTKLRALPDDIPALTGAIEAALAGMAEFVEATAADRQQTGEDRSATGEDREAAGASAALSQKWATQTDAEVAVGQGYGAKKYAQDASASATTAVNNAAVITALLNEPLDDGNQADPDGSILADDGIQGT